ncbi:MAG: DnaJ domain-containing protein [Brevinematales bacterium]|nr:DnaJ domain-containing protein [Brevinematales bacterium]
MKDPYEILGLDPTADIDTIKKRFRELSKKYHPDKNPTAQEIYKEIVIAYRLLISEKALSPANRHASRSLPTIPPERIHYNLSLINILSEGFKISRDFSTEDYLDHFQADITVELYKLELVLGYQIPLMIPTRQLCPVCEGHNEHCYRCQGKGFVTSTLTWPITLPSTTRPEEIVEIDLTPLKQAYPTLHIKRQSLRIRCQLLDHDKL